MQQTIETIYDAVADPSGWAQVMRGVRALFRTDAEALYFLDHGTRTKEVLHIDGIDSDFIRTFESAFYTPDNPCTASPELHRVGVVRTDEKLSAYFNNGDVLLRSCYYNEWMRPQRLRHTMGTTPIGNDRRHANLSLLRSAATGPFTAAEVKQFTDLGGHLRRALRLAERLDTLTAGRGLAARALDALHHGIVLLNEEGRALHANRAAEVLFADVGGLRLRHGRIGAVSPTADAQLGALVRRLCNGTAGHPRTGPVIVRTARGRQLWVNGVRLSGRHRGFLGARPVVLLVIVDPGASDEGVPALMRRLYRLSRPETRLAEELIAGKSLREAADAARVTYETARTYLKAIFQKTETSRQGELVARILSDVAAAAQCAIGGTE